MDEVINDLQEILNNIRLAESQQNDQMPEAVPQVVEVVLQVVEAVPQVVEPPLTTERLKNDITQHYLNFLNMADREQLKAAKGIGDIRADCILKHREKSAQAFESRMDLKMLGLSDKQIENMLKNWAARLFD